MLLIAFVVAPIAPPAILKENGIKKNGTNKTIKPTNCERLSCVNPTTLPEVDAEAFMSIIDNRSAMPNIAMIMG